MKPQASRYTADLNLRGVNDAHILAIGRVPANSRVLDLGLADGSVATLLKDMGCRVWGVELDPVDAEAARGSCEEVVVADLTTLDLAEQFQGLRFDVILMLDVLEHLSNPAEVLERMKPVLADRGWGVISLPNVAHLSLRLSLLKGHFNYTDVGLLDRTHLRFFDRAGVDDLLREAGWGMFDLARVTRRLGTTEIHIDDVDPELARAIGIRDRRSHVPVRGLCGAARFRCARASPGSARGRRSGCPPGDPGADRRAGRGGTTAPPRAPSRPDGATDCYSRQRSGAPGPSEVPASSHARKLRGLRRSSFGLAR